MSSEAVRIESETLRALRERSAQSGEPIVRLAQRYISEGMRLDRHPGIFFRDGAAGRRAVVIGGPDVWEVIAAARSAPEHGEQLISALTERTGSPVEKIRAAIRYYGEFPDEVDRFIAANEQEAAQLERVLENEQRLLG
jgi:nitrogenase molybdenum-iron protein alpha/beta subunit